MRAVRVLTPAQELRAMQREAKVLWLQVRAKAGIKQFTDPAALRTLRYAVERAFPCEWRDLEAAIKKQASTSFCRSPWYLDQAIRLARADREELEAHDRRMRERAAIEEPQDPRVLDLIRSAAAGMRA